MMKTIGTLLLTILFLQMDALCQSPWSIEINSSVDYQFLDFKDVEGIPQSDVNGYTITDRTFNYSFGVSIVREINDRFEIVGGVNYVNRDIRGQCYCHICDKIAFPTELLQFDFIRTNIATRLYFNKEHNQWNPFLSVGINSMYFINQKDWQEAFYRPKNISVGMNISGGLKYILSDKFSIITELMYVESFQHLIRDDSFKIESIGLQLGINRHF